MTVGTETVPQVPVTGRVTTREPVPTRGVARFRLVVRSEWIKLRSLRSTRVTLLGLFVATVGIGALACGLTAAHWGSMAFKEKMDFDPTGQSLNGGFLGQLFVGVLGTLAVTSEYGSGMIRATFAAVPQRRHVLAAKALMVAVTVLVVGTVTSFVAFGVGQALLSSTGRSVTLADPGELRAVVGAGLYLTVIALLGVAVGAVVRSTAGSVSTLLGLLFVPPILAELFPGGWHRAILRYSPMNAGSRVLMVPSQSNALGPWAGLGMLVLYTAIIGVVGFWLVSRRDA